LRISKAIRKALALKHLQLPWNSECHAKQIKTDQNIMTHHDSWLTAVTRNFHKSDLIQNLTDQFIPGDLALVTWQPHIFREKPGCKGLVPGSSATFRAFRHHGPNLRRIQWNSCHYLMSLLDVQCKSCGVELLCCRAAGWGKLHRGRVRPFQGAVDAVGQDTGPMSLWIL
jgi:hypothetical protein